MRGKSKKPDIRIGISGWTYAPWHGVFYPKSLRRSSEAELTYASRRFPTIEINGSFYALQRPKSYERWYEQTPDDFVFSVKATRYITHIRRLNEIRSPLANFFASGLLGLEEKLGPILWQFPPNFRYDAQKLQRFIDLLPDTPPRASALAAKHESWMRGRARIQAKGFKVLRHAVEVRNDSFADPKFFDSLRERGIALVVSHSTDRWPMFEERTADFAYARLHGQGELYSGEYGDVALAIWARKVKQWTSSKGGSRDVYLYFDNDAKVKAPFDATKLMARLGIQKTDISFGMTA